jgi:hypothetical protein
VADLAFGDDVIGADQVELVDVRLRYEFVDVDGPGALERDVVELVLVDGDVGVGVDLVALDDVETSSPLSASTLAYLMR